MKKILLASFLILFSISSQADFAKGKEAFEQKNYSVAFSNFLTEADRGDKEAQYYTGYMYLKGFGVEQNFDKALNYLTKSAQQDFPQAFFILGVMCFKGDGVPKDLARGRAYLELAGNHEPAQTALSQLNAAGISISETAINYQKASIRNELGFHDVYVAHEEIAFKPIIYLYPKEITNVTVALGYPENTTHTYPKYNEPWQVQAEPNGDLTDLKTGRHYYALYWEGKNTVSNKNPTDGFIVKGENTIKFLEEKLDLLGLTEREAEEFIVYWLPKLEGYSYNFIRFQTVAEQNKNMPLTITPAPKTPKVFA